MGFDASHGDVCLCVYLWKHYKQITYDNRNHFGIYRKIQLIGFWFNKAEFIRQVSQRMYNLFILIWPHRESSIISGMQIKSQYNWSYTFPMRTFENFGVKMRKIHYWIARGFERNQECNVINQWKNFTDLAWKISCSGLVIQTGQILWWPLDSINAKWHPEFRYYVLQKYQKQVSHFL